MGPWASSLRPSVRIKSSPKCSGMELQDLHLGPVRPHRVLLRGAGCPSRIPKVHLLGDAGRIPSRSQEAGLAGEEREDVGRGEEKAPGHAHGGATP